MPVVVADKDDQYVLNHCTRFLARDGDERRHDFGQYTADDPRGKLCEAWRYPIIDSYSDGASVEASYAYNAVTFVYDGRADAATDVAVTGTFTELHAQADLRPVAFLGEPSGIWALSVRVPKGQVHSYKLRVDGAWRTDPINPQSVVLDNGRTWSRFFTEGCQIPLSFSRHDRELLGRLVSHLLPFRLKENSRFIREVYEGLDRRSREQQFPLAYRLDEEVGVVNYIDKLIARAENHHADDYHSCLDIIDGLLRTRYPGRDPLMLPRDAFADLYAEMATDQVTGWDTDRYGSPRHFLLLLRRHAMTGAFVHPRHGGNSGTAGWVYLESRFRDQQDRTLFDWRATIEAPLGHNTDYRG
ncbi:MAG: gluconate 2-dehydrogenase subunit 3 family protein [Actinomycetota bacterium]|nr:gluconate 2-dehydrogenase subunit 3 family protein [Actinomycetota bacterium]